MKSPNRLQGVQNFAALAGGEHLEINNSDRELSLQNYHSLHGITLHDHLKLVKQLSLSTITKYTNLLICRLRFIQLLLIFNGLFALDLSQFVSFVNHK